MSTPLKDVKLEVKLDEYESRSAIGWYQNMAVTQSSVLRKTTLPTRPYVPPKSPGAMATHHHCRAPRTGLAGLETELSLDVPVLPLPPSTGNRPLYCSTKLLHTKRSDQAEAQGLVVPLPQCSRHIATNCLQYGGNTASRHPTPSATIIPKSHSQSTIRLSYENWRKRVLVQ